MKLAPHDMCSEVKNVTSVYVKEPRGVKYKLPTGTRKTVFEITMHIFLHGLAS
jgi:hypothetical protein